MEDVALTLQLVASLYLTGLLWFVQLVHYPMMATVPAELFVAWERENVARTTWAVGPMILLEATTAVAMLVTRPLGVPTWVAWLGMALLLLVDGSTALYFGPMHGRLAKGFDAALHRRLVRGNWVRTFGWTARGLLMVYAARLAWSA